MNWWKRRGEELDDEMRKHLEFGTQQNIDAGMALPHLPQSPPQFRPPPSLTPSVPIQPPENLVGVPQASHQKP
jgi:hypothetical protein